MLTDTAIKNAKPQGKPVHLSERRAMMQQWADPTDETAKVDGKVTPIKKASM
jgi:hypothetical protein